MDFLSAAIAEHWPPAPQARPAANRFGRRHDPARRSSATGGMPPAPAHLRARSSSVAKSSSLSNVTMPLGVRETNRAHRNASHISWDSSFVHPAFMPQAATQPPLFAKAPTLPSTLGHA